MSPRLHGVGPDVSDPSGLTSGMHDVFIFLHIGDSGGTAIARAIWASAPPEEILNCYKSNTTDRVADHLDRLPRAKLDRTRYVIGHMAWYGIHEHFPGTPRYFTFLRNPVSRIIASYFRIRRRPSNPLHARVSAMSFREFVERIPLATNMVTSILARTDGNRGFVNRLYDERLLATAERNLDRFWFVGIYESYRADAEHLCAALDIDPASMQPTHVRPTDQDETREALSDCAILHAVGARNLMDQALYSKELLTREQRLVADLRANAGEAAPVVG